MVKSPKFSKVPLIFNTLDDVLLTGPKFTDRKYDRGFLFRFFCFDLFGIAVICKRNLTLFLTQFCSIVPIFLISSVTGKNLNLIKTFLNLLPPQVRHNDSLTLMPADFMVCRIVSFLSSIFRFFFACGFF